MMMRALAPLVCVLFLCFSFSAWTEEEGAEAQVPPPESAPAESAPAAVPLSRGFRNLSLGMSLDDLKAGLAGDGLFNFRGDRDVSFLPQRDQSLIETTGSSFIRRAFFQLRDGEVFIMGFALNTALVDHYSVFTSLVKKYGEPSSLDPREAVWERDGVRISIERPLTVKYIDMRVFNSIIDQAALAESREIRLREEFLDEF
ncbi:MAG: hypothetical protein LBI86_09470 [Treponema sp.]|jgi:hypothetical protein|nr:hypothetical protein [Treponema sp.]